MGTLREGQLFGMGNPLLDIQAGVDKHFLDKWGLKENDSILCGDKHIPMFDELAAMQDVQYLPGGATQNTLRALQWIVNKPKVTTFMGCIGNDRFGKILAERLTEAGVNAVYQINQKEKTGTCAACIYGEYRSLCAHLAAANCFTKDHLDEPGHQALIEKADYYYIAGFFLTVCPPAIQHVAEHACSKNKYFMMNLSAPFLTSIFKEPMMAAMPYVDIIFGNETEALEFAKNQDLKTESVPEIALKLCSLPKKNTKRSRMAVITQGPDPVIIAQDGKVRQFPVASLKPEQIVDTNGAGDSFVAGFLAQLIQGRPLEDCVRCGNYAATTIIQRTGCSLPDKCDYA